MKRILPTFRDIPFCTYQNYAFYQNIALLDSNFINVMYNSFINIEWIYDELKIINDFSNINVEWVMHDFDWLLSFDGIISDVKSYIDQGLYVSGMYDEFYIKEKEAYKQYHFWHDYYLFGYDDDKCCFYSLGYTKERKYTEFKISYNEFVESIQFREVQYQKFAEFSNYFLILSYTPNKSFGRLSPLLIYNNLLDYRYPQIPKDLMDKCDGIFCLDALCQFFANGDFDIRFPRIIMEHKQHMYNRINYINEKTNIKIPDSIAVQYQREVVDKSRMLFYLSIKYHLTSKITIVSSLIEGCQAIKKQEEELLPQLLEVLIKEESNLIYK